MAPPISDVPPPSTVISTLFKFGSHNSRSLAEKHPDILDQAEGLREKIKQHFKDYGCWDDEEIDEWDDVTTAAMVIQEAAASLREMERFDSPEEWMVALEKGDTDGRTYHHDGKYYLSIG